MRQSGARQVLQGGFHLDRQGTRSDDLGGKRRQDMHAEKLAVFLFANHLYHPATHPLDHRHGARRNGRGPGENLVAGLIGLVFAQPHGSSLRLDTRQWVQAAKAAGITRMILTAKHHDGFCLWPSKYTEHCVSNSPWKGGKGDVVGEFVEACRAEGMHIGIYISPWDRHEQSYGDSPKYNQYFLNQLREVLTTYPGVEEVWFDGACAEGPNGKRQEYDWRAYWKLIRELAPNAAITVRGPDVRWCGNEAGYTRKSEWSVLPMPGDDQP